MSGPVSPPRVVVILQAHMGSTRLPGKVLKPLAGEPMLARVVERCRRARRIHEVVVATSTLPADDVLAGLCAQRGWPCVRGSDSDVLGRYLQAAGQHHADIVVRITSDCPFSDPAVIDAHIERLLASAGRVDFVSNLGFPLGLSVEVMPRALLERIGRESQAAYQREHVTAAVYDRGADFRIEYVVHERDLSAMRWTVDEPADLEFAQRVFEHFGHDRFTWLEALAAVEQHPAWQEINRHVKQKAP